MRHRGLGVPERVVAPSPSWPENYERFVKKNITRPGEFASYARAAAAADTLLAAAHTMSSD